MKRKRSPPNEEALNKKFSTSTIGSKRLMRQKQHYIYNVTEDKLPYNFNVLIIIFKRDFKKNFSMNPRQAKKNAALQRYLSIEVI